MHIRRFSAKLGDRTGYSFGDCRLKSTIEQKKLSYASVSYLSVKIILEHDFMEWPSELAYRVTFSMPLIPLKCLFFFRKAKLVILIETSFMRDIVTLLDNARRFNVLDTDIVVKIYLFLLLTIFPLDIRSKGISRNEEKTINVTPRRTRAKMSPGCAWFIFLEQGSWLPSSCLFWIIAFGICNKPLMICVSKIRDSMELACILSMDVVIIAMITNNFFPIGFKYISHP